MFGAKKYRKLISQNLISKLTSDISVNSKQNLNLNIVSVGVQNHLPIPTQYMYLYFLTKKMAFYGAKTPFKKKYRFGEMAKDTAKGMSYPNQFKLAVLLKKLYYKLMRGQLSPEYAAIRIDKNYTKIIVWNAPLTKETQGLQTNQNAFLADIPMYYKFYSKEITFREAAFCVRFYEFLRPKFATTWHLQMSEYHYTE